jgi:hypothetical protein
MEPAIVAAIRRLVDNAPGIIEAHLPQVFVPGAMEAPAQVLVIVVADADSQRAVDRLGSGLGSIVPRGRSIDVWPLRPGDPLLPTIRAAGCGLRSPDRTGILRHLRRHSAASVAEPNEQTPHRGADGVSTGEWLKALLFVVVVVAGSVALLIWFSFTFLFQSCCVPLPVAS